MFICPLLHSTVPLSILFDVTVVAEQSRLIKFHLGFGDHRGSKVPKRFVSNQAKMVTNAQVEVGQP